MVPFPVTLSDPLPRFQGHVVLCAQLTRDLFVIAKFLFLRNGIPMMTLLTGASSARWYETNCDFPPIFRFIWKIIQVRAILTISD